MLTSLVFASVICLGSFFFFVTELGGVLHVARPLFWLPISVGTFGIAGSNYIYLKTYLKRP